MQSYLSVFFPFLPGLIWGSFLNVVILRWGNGESLVWSRSHCRSCGKILHWYELVPLFSFLVQLGRCRSCKAKLAWQYPVVEIFSGLIAVAAFSPIGMSNWSLVIFVRALWLFILLSCFLVLFFIDIREKLLPLPLMGIAFFATLVWKAISGLLAGDFTEMWWALAMGGGGFFFFFIIWAVSRGRWMGLGDAYLALVIGFSLGWPKALVSFLFAFWLGGLVGLVLVVLHKKTFGEEIPFGPFLILPAVYFLFYSPPHFFDIFYAFSIF